MKTVMISGWGTTREVWKRTVESIPSSEEGICHVGWERESLLDGITEEVILVGWSLGAIRALEEADRNPEQVAGLVLVSGTLSFCGGEEFPGTNPRTLKAMRMRLKRERTATLRDFAALCSKSRDFAEHFSASAEKFSTEILGQGLAALQNSDLSGISPQVPTVVLHGTNDRVIPVAAGSFLATCLGADLKLLDGMEHDLPLTAAEKIAAAIEEVREKVDR